MDRIDIESKEEWFDALEEDDQTKTYKQHSHVTVLKEEDIRKRMDNAIQSVSDIYLVSKYEAILLLPHFLRDVSEFHKKWFDDDKSVRLSVGLLDQALDALSDDKDKDKEEEFFCGVCYKLHLLENSASVSCGHRVCTCCWKRHVNNIINDVPAPEWYWTLKCPYECCLASVGLDMVERFASEKEKIKYDRYLFRSYIQDSKMMTCCPAPGSNCRTDLSHDVFCLCLLSFCWNCSKDAHSPVDCKTAAKWLEMNISDKLSPNWVLENTVPCPMCKRRIKENQDCSLKMTCLPPCNYEFCWRCCREWTEHREESGWDLYTCNFNIVYDEETDSEKMAEIAANRYKYCHENWESNELLMQEAKAKLQKLHTDYIPELSNTQLATIPQLEFIAEAWSQIMECRRVLKWTYVYGYHLKEDEVEKLDFLKHTQEDAEIPLKELYYYAKYKLESFLDEGDEPTMDFTKFSFKLTTLTSITRNHYERLVRVLEDGLTNVVPALLRSQRADNEDVNGLDHNQGLIV
ncbi:unnamed protein product [Cochlearia groenlandica]